MRGSGWFTVDWLSFKFSFKVSLAWAHLLWMPVGFLSRLSLTVFWNQLWLHCGWSFVDVQEPPCDKMCSFVIEWVVVLPISS